MSELEEVGGKMRAAREQQRLSLTEMASELGYTKSRLSSIEQGGKRPSIDIIEGYERVLRLSKPLLSKEERQQLRTRPGKPASFLAFDPSGVIAIHPELTRDLLDTKILSSKSRMWFMDIWFRRSIEAFQHTIPLLQGTIDIRILLAEPDSKFGRERGQYLNRPRNYVEQQINENIHFFNEEMRGKVEGKDISISIRCHNQMPSVPILIFDQSALLGFYFREAEGNFAPWLEIHIRQEGDPEGLFTDFGRFVEKEFLHLWEHKKVTRKIDIGVSDA